MALDVSEDYNVTGDDDDKWNWKGRKGLDPLEGLGLRVGVQVTAGVMLLVVAETSDAKEGWNDHGCQGNKPQDAHIGVAPNCTRPYFKKY